MEGVGSRLGRTSSRYGGPTAASAVFNGRVRKWKKKWVHVSTPSTVSSRSSLSNGRRGNNNVGSSHLLLCRWTPLSSSTTTTASAAVAGGPDVSSSAETEEQPRRKFRYTPTVVVEERGRGLVKRVEDEAKTDETYPFEPGTTSENFELNMNRDLKNENQDSNVSHLDLGLCLKGLNDDYDQDQDR